MGEKMNEQHKENYSCLGKKRSCSLMKKEKMKKESPIKRRKM